MNYGSGMAMVFLLFGFAMLQANELPVPKFDGSSTVISKSGYQQLTWTVEAQNEKKLEFELQQALDEQFAQVSTIYKGPDFATFLSGLENGHYYYRVRSMTADKLQKSSWSTPKTVEIKHHSLTLALSLFGLGAVVFLATVWIVIQGSREVHLN